MTTEAVAITSVPSIEAREKKKGSIVDRILWILVIWGFLIYAMAVAGIWWGSSFVIEKSFETQATQWVNKLDEMGTPLYVADESLIFQDIKEHLTRFPEVAYVRYYKAENNRIIAEYRSAYLPVIDIPKLSEEHLAILSERAGAEEAVYFQNTDNAFALLQATAPILIRSVESDGFMEFNLQDEQAGDQQYKIIGYIEIGLDFGVHREHLIQNILRGSLPVAVIFLLAVVIGRIVIKRALQPLTSLSEPLRKLADGNIDVRVDGANDREIDAISKALNTTIAALKDRDEKLQQLANCDPLTGLLNKQNFKGLLTQELRRVTDEGDSSALIFIDLDEFKFINDSLGHAAGDRLLVQVAGLLTERTRESDVLARFGGDEFVVVAKSVSEEEAESITQSILTGMQEYVFVENNETFNIFCSLGVAMIDEPDMSIEEVFSRADLACFQAKSSGRNCYHIYDEDTLIQAGKGTDLSWSKTLGDALENDLFLLKFQPVIGLAETDCDFYQVQMQVKLDNGDLVDSAIFMLAAERIGMADKIGDWLLRQALKKVESVSVNGRKIKLLVGLSGHHFEQSDFMESFSAALEAFQVEPESIIFQLGERSVIKQLEPTKKRMKILSKTGCRFCLDLVNAGSSNYSYLKGLPVDYLKFDASLLAGTKVDPIKKIMTEAVIRIAADMEMQTIGDYARNKMTIDVLGDLGVNFAQGSFIAKPTTTLHANSYEKLRKKFRK